MSEHVHRDQEHDLQSRLGLRPKYKQILSSCAALCHFFQDSRGSGQAPWHLWIACCVQRLRLALLSHMVTGRASFFTAMSWMQCQQGGASKAGALCVFQCPPQEKTEKAGPHPLMSHFDVQNKSCMEMKRLCQDPMDHTCTLPRSTQKWKPPFLVCSFCQTCVHSRKITAHHFTFIFGQSWVAGPRFIFDMSMFTLSTSLKVSGGRPVLGSVCKPFQVHLLGCSVRAVKTNAN